MAQSYVNHPRSLIVPRRDFRKPAVPFLGQNEPINQSLVACWLLGEFGNGKYRDVSDYSQNGTGVGNPVTGQSHHGGLSTAFNGSTQYVSLGTAPPQITFAPTKQFTISLWASAASAIGPGVFPGVFGCAATANRFGYSIYGTNGGVAGFFN